jgi:hypothetical protein
LESNVEKVSKVYEAHIESKNRYRLLHWAGSEGRLPAAKWVVGVLSFGARGGWNRPCIDGHRESVVSLTGYREVSV